MLRRGTSFLILALLSPSCAAVSQMVPVHEPDVARTRLADTRDQVEQKLGRRLWRAGVSDGLTYDIYRFKAARPPQFLRGSVLLFFDVLLWGLPEVPWATSQRIREDFKEVAIAFDHQGRVRFVSPPWGIERGTPEPCQRARSLLPVSSGVPADARPSFADRPADVSPQIARLELTERHMRVAIDGRTAKARVVDVTPGRHALRYQADFAKAELIVTRHESYDQAIDVELLPGRLYRLKYHRFYPEQADVFWLEDVESREALSCGG